VSSQRGGKPVAVRRCMLKQPSTAVVRSANASSTKLAPARITRRAKSVAPCVKPARRHARRQTSLPYKKQRSTAAVRSASCNTAKLVPARITCWAKSVAPCVEPAPQRARHRASLHAKAAEHRCCTEGQ